MSTPTKQTPSQPLESTDPTQPPQRTSTATTQRSPFNLIQTSTPLSDIPKSTANSTTLLLHATNAFGTWGAGFAKALQKNFPSAEKIYKSWCDEYRPSPNEWPSRDLVGRCLVVPPQEGDGGGDKVWIGCLFTSYGYGGRAVRGGKGGGHAGKDGVGRVVESTRGALEELRGWVREFEGGSTSGNGGDGAEEDEGQKETSKIVIYSPKFNSGNFGVDWEVTTGMIREVFGDWDGEWRILANL